VFFADADAIQNAGIVFWIGLNVRKLIDLKSGKQFFYLVIKSDLLDASGTAGHKNLFSERLHYFRQIGNNSFSEKESGIRSELRWEALQNACILPVPPSRYPPPDNHGSRPLSLSQAES